MLKREGVTSQESTETTPIGGKRHHSKPILLILILFVMGFPPQRKTKNETKQQNREMSKKTERIEVIYVVRHGERYDWDHPEWTKESPRPWDSPLSEHGLEQAEEVAKFLCNELGGTKPNAIMSSPLIRAVQTSVPTAKAIGNRVRIERGMTEWPVRPQLPDTEIATMFEAGIIDPTIGSLLDPPMTPVEDIPATHVRGRAMMSALLSAESAGTLRGTIIMFGHAASCITLIRAALADPTRQFELPACGISKLVRTDDGHGWKAQLLGHTGHLCRGAEHLWSFEIFQEIEKQRRASKPPSAC